MNQTLPQVTFPEEFEGRGVIYGPTDRLKAEHVLLECSKYRGGSEIQVSVQMEEQPYWRTDKLFYAPRIGIVGTTVQGRPFRIPDFRWRSHNEAQAHGFANEVHWGERVLPEQPTDQHLHAQLTPSWIAPRIRGMMLHSWTGEITSDTQYPPQRFVTALGEIEFSLEYRHERVSVEGIEGAVHLPLPGMRLRVAPLHRTRQVQALLERFRANVEEICSLLSFLGRRSIHCSILHHSAVWRGKDGLNHSESGVQRYVPATNPPGSLEEYVVPGRLKERDLDIMLRRLRLSPFGESARRASVFLLSSMSRGVLEQKVVDAFTALETLTDGYSEVKGLRNVLSKSQFKLVRGRLEETLSTLATDMALDDDLRDQLCRKLGTVNTAPLIPRIVKLVEELEVEWDDLWPMGTKLGTALGSAYSRRSALVHAGKVAYDALFIDVLRMQALTERAIAQVVGVKEAWLAPGAYSHVRYVSNAPL